MISDLAESRGRCFKLSSAKMGVYFGCLLVSMYGGSADASFEGFDPPDEYPILDGGQAVVAAKLNADSLPDIVVANSLSIGGHVSVFMSNGDGTLATPRVDYGVQSGARWTEAADMDGTFIHFFRFNIFYVI
jgi:hypothetical protein